MTVRELEVDAVEQVGAEIARRERVLLLLALAFLLTAISALGLCDRQPAVCNATFIPRDWLFVAPAWVLCFGTAHVVLSRRLPERDPLLLPVAAFLSGWGLIEVGRLAPNFLPRQLTWLLLSTLAMLVVTLAGKDLRWLRRFRYTWLLIGLLLLAATLFLGVNPSGYGPRLWLGLGGAYLQPSEPLKLLMVIFLASYLAERRELLLVAGRRVGPFRLPPVAYVGPLVVMFGVTVLLLAVQQDLGAAMLFFFTFLSMLYVATGRWEYVATGLLLFLLAGVLGYAGSARLAVRVDGWLNPWAEAADRAFQIVQSLIAFGAGRLLGEGVGMGWPTYIPAVHTDFVFAAIGEEFGLAGIVAIIGLYGILLARGFRSALRAAHPFKQLLAAGLTAGLMIQAWIIMAANAKLVPIAGVTLPFLSYGGSSLLATFVALGLILRISSPETRQPVPRRLNFTPLSARVRSLRLPMLHLAFVLGLGLAVLAAACGYWSVWRAGWLTAREDNPRRVVYEQHVVRGEIVDREGTLLAGVEVGPEGLVTRTYPMPEAAPVVGYASLRYGTGGVEAAFDALLRGEAARSAQEAAWDELLHRPPVGQDVQLSVQADVQRLAQAALEGRTGTVVLLDAQTGEVLAMASAPTFDPARLEEVWDQLREDPAAPLVNRATQGLYQPGAALETVVLAETLERDLVYPSDPVSRLTDTVRVDGAALGCLEEPSVGGSLLDAYQAACPGPFTILGEALGEEGLSSAVAGWGLTTPPPLEVPTESGAWAPDDLALEGVGQGELTVSPLQMALVAATLANEGVMPVPRLVLATEDVDDGWQPTDVSGVVRPVTREDIVQTLFLGWRSYGPDVLGHLGTAIAGEERPPHAWFLGVAPAGRPQYALAVLLEHPDDPQDAAAIGREVLEAALGP